MAILSDPVNRFGNAQQPGSMPDPGLLSALRGDKDVKHLGINDDIDLALVSRDEDHIWEPLEIIGGVTFQDAGNSSRNLKCGSLDGQPVLVDFKHFDRPSEEYHQDKALAEPAPYILN